MIPCNKHGQSNWCYIQDDGSHIDSERCDCFNEPSEDCPIDEHKHQAENKRINKEEMPKKPWFLLNLP